MDTIQACKYRQLTHRLPLKIIFILNDTNIASHFQHAYYSQSITLYGTRHCYVAWSVARPHQLQTSWNL